METQAERTGGEAQPESTKRQETQAERTGGEAQPESTNRHGDAGGADRRGGAAGVDQ